MQIVIFSSPGRSRLLVNLKKELLEFDIHVINDKKSFGKENFWKRWEMARMICLESEHDNYMIIPDDISNIDIDEIKDIHNHFRNKAFVCNATNDGRNKCWNSFINTRNALKSEKYEYTDIGFFDCGGITNRKTLSMFRVDKVPDSWFNRPDKSSGVGYQLTIKFRKLKIPMYKTTPSLCFHGDHKSIMHTEHRKKNPLITHK